MMEEKKIIFVCTGNTCRSPMAEAVLRSEFKRLNIGDVSVFSAGLEPSKNGNINPHSAAVLSENGLSIENFAARAGRRNADKRICRYLHDGQPEGYPYGYAVESFEKDGAFGN